MNMEDSLRFYKEFSSFCQEFEKLVPNHRDWPKEKEFSLRIAEIIDSRRKSDLPTRDLKAKDRAEILASVIPKEPLEEIQKRAERCDRDALLTLGDCYYFGLKGVKLDCKKGISFYEEAAFWNQPEAISMLIYNNYLFQISYSSLTEGDPIPANISSTNPQYKNIVKEMWDLLEKLVDLNWITPFFYKLGDDARRTKSYSVSKKIFRELVKLDIADLKDKKEKDEKFKFKCTNPKCTDNWIETKIMMISCERCRKAKYCSQECHQAHYGKHWNVCPKNIPIDSSIPQTSQHVTRISFSSAFKAEFVKNFQMKEFQTKIEPQERKNFLINNFTVQNFKTEAEKLLNRRRFGPAVKYLNLAIDKIISDTLLNTASRAEFQELTELYAKKINCLLKLAESSRVITYYLDGLKDCKFVLENANYKRDWVKDLDAYKQIEAYKIKIEGETEILKLGCGYIFVRL